MLNKFSLVILFFSSCAVLYVNCASGLSTTTAPAPLSNTCMGCICEASSGCNRTIQCEGDVCGLFKITHAYWIDAKRPTVDKDDDPKSNNAYVKCTLNEICAGTTVSNYVTRFAQDCNEDGKIDCYDYAAIHQRGGYGGCKYQPLQGEYLRKYTDCITQINKLGGSTQS